MVNASKAGYNSNSVAVTVTTGQATVADITLNEITPDLAISPNPLSFGSVQTSILLNLVNQVGSGTISWTAASNRSWIQLSATEGQVTNQTTHLTITVSRDTLSPGNYSGNIIFTSNGGNPTVQVLMSVQNPSLPQLSLNVSMLDFDTLLTSKLFTISNSGSNVLNWQITSNQTWLTANPVSGTTAPDSSRSITVSVIRTGLTSGTHNGNLSIISNGGSFDLPVVLRVLPTRPFAPSNLRAQLGDSRSIALTWSDNSTDEEGFRVERRRSTQTSFSTLTTLLPNSVAYTDTGLLPHARYIYRVYAFNQNVNSDYTNLDSATIANVVPNSSSDPSPANAATNQPCNGSLQWTASDPDLDTLTYDIYLGSGSSLHLIASNISAQTVAFSGLRSDSLYSWRVNAKDRYSGINVGQVWTFNTAPPVGTTFSVFQSPSNTQQGRYVQQTFDHGYICVGSTGTDASQYHMWVAKFSETGTQIWARIYGGAAEDEGHCIKQIADGGYIAVGTTSSYGHGNTDVWLVRMNSDGDTLWTKTFGGTGYDEGWSVLQTANNEFVIVGQTYSFGNDRQMYIIKTNSLGQEIWHQTYGGPYYDGMFALTETSDHGYAASGWKFDAAGNSTWWLLKVNSSGTYLWDRTYSTGNLGSSYSLCQLTNGDFALTGIGYNTLGVAKLFIIRTDGSGNQLWSRQYGGIGADFGNCVIKTADGGLAVSGMTQSYGAGGNDAWLLKVSSNGDSLWSRTFGSSGDEVGVNLQQTYDGGYVILGNASATGGSNSNIWLLKTDPNGNVTGMR